MTIRTVESPLVRQAEPNFDPVVSAALERIESAADNIRHAQEDLWKLAKKDASLGHIAVQLAATLGTLEARRRELEEGAGL